MLTNLLRLLKPTYLVANKNEENSFHDREITNLIPTKDPKGPIKQGFGSHR